MREKIVWSEAERATIVAKAVDLAAEDPKLTGLNMLRAALQALPVGRRRRLIALSQAPWFLPMLRAEIARRAQTGQADEVVTVIRETLVTQQGWRDKHLADLDSTQDVLHQLVELTSAENAKLDALLAGSDAKAEGIVAASQEMVMNMAKTQAQMVELLTHIVTEVRQLKEVINKRYYASSAQSSRPMCLGLRTAAAAQRPVSRQLPGDLDGRVTAFDFPVKAGCALCPPLRAAHRGAVFPAIACSATAACSSGSLILRHLVSRRSGTAAPAPPGPGSARAA